MPAFDAIIGNNPRVLILGSMPGRASLNTFEYYAHPRNSFWWIMATLFDFDLTSSYQHRCQQLINNKIAVWDVLYDCERPGSLDSAIIKHSEEPNDFQMLLTKHESLTKIIFNGAAAEKIFQRYNAQLMSNITANGQMIKCHRCPSTSPAYASISQYDKLNEWADALVE